MTGGVLGGGVIFVVAAVLWAAVLVPAWMRRREFKAAEQNAVRLQRTLRVLAETAEVPTEVRAEATAREALAQEKILRIAQRRQEAERQAKLAEARAAQVRAQIKAQQVKRTQAALVRAAKLRRPWVRRLRGLTAVLALVAILTVLVGAGLAMSGQGLTILGAGALGLAATTAALFLMAPGRAKAAPIEAENLNDELRSPATRSAIATAEADTVGDAARTAAQAESRAAHVANQSAAAATLDRARLLARARAEAKDRAAELAATPRLDTVVQGAIDRSLREETHAEQPRRSTRLPLAEQLQQMGVVGDTREGMPDLDAALRRHRNAS